MKYLTIIAAVPMLLAINGCNNGNSQSTHIDNAGNEGRGVKTLTMKNDSISLHIEYSGDIQLNETENGFRNISEKGYVHYRNNNDRMDAENPSGSGINYTLRQGNTTLKADGAGQAFIAHAIREMIAYGFEADERIARLYAHGGNDALLNGIKDIRVDYVKVRYLEKVARQQPTPETMMVVMKESAAITSDFEKGKLLRQFKADSLQGALFPAYMAAVASIRPTFERSNVLRYIADQPLTDEQFSQLLEVWSSLDGEFEKTELLKHIASRGLPTDTQWIALVHAASRIGSNFEKANVLVRIAEKLPAKANLKVAYQQAAAGITDKNEKEKALKAVS